MAYRALIVDDEVYAVMGIRSGVKWEELQIAEVYEAFHIREAMQVMNKIQIDILICDIEMPRGNGIELLEWVNEHSPNTETIFLTAHSNFSFVQRAIQLDGFDYLLKPVEYHILQTTIGRALDTIKEERELASLREQYKPYYNLWLKKKSLITDKFWNDLFSKKITCTKANTERLIHEYVLPLTAHTLILPIVISIEGWDRELNSADEEVLEYALRNIARDLMLQDRHGDVIQTKLGVNCVLLFLERADELDDLWLEEQCRQYIRYCHQYLYGYVSCYIGKPAVMSKISDMYHKLLDMEYSMMKKNSEVHWLKEQHSSKSDAKLPAFNTWTVLIEQGKKDDMERELCRFFSKLNLEAELNTELLHSFYHSYMQMIHYILYKHGLSLHHLLLSAESSYHEAMPRSIIEMEEWSRRLLCIVHEQLHKDDSVIHRVQRYIRDHLSDTITREELADHVHLNPAYLSRLFKKEVGESLTDYVLNERMKVARELIESSTLPISDIAQSVGYTNFSYFTKMFKKQYQCTPQHYRRQLEETAMRSNSG